MIQAQIILFLKVIIMKKHIVIGLTLGVLLSVLSGCGGVSDIGNDKAVQIALDAARLTETDISRLYVEKNLENGKDTYEVKFTNGSKEYEYEILADDGKIVKASFSIEDRAFGIGDNNVPDNNSTESTPQQGQNKSAVGNKNPSSEDQISLADASKLVLARVPGATAKDLKIELDYDDGKYLYEGDIVYDGKEYEFEIDAVTGNFLEWSEEKR